MIRPEPSPLSRRLFLRRAALFAGGIGALSACSPGPADPGSRATLSETPPARTHGVSAPPSAASTPPVPPGRLVPGAVEGRVLVVVDLRGGNDGLSTLVPIDNGRLRDLRPNLMVEPDGLLVADNDMGFHPALARLHARGLGTVEGVGPIDGDLSHFAMTDRWQRGDVSGTGGVRSGFLGRLCDALSEGDDIVGLSLAGAASTMSSPGDGQTIALSSLGDLDLFRRDWHEAEMFIDGLLGFGSTDEWAATVADSYGRLSDLATVLARRTGDDAWHDGWDVYEGGGELGVQLHAAARLIEADTGIRVVYTATGDYDTHDAHLWRQEDNLGVLDAAVAGFLDDVAATGAGDRVLVATISEFGRRVPENADGLDHGSASTMLLAGAGMSDGPRLGDRPELDDLDDDDNLRVTVGFDRYLASLAEDWLGVEASSVLPGEPRPLGLLS